MIFIVEEIKKDFENIMGDEELMKIYNKGNRISIFMVFLSGFLLFSHANTFLVGYLVHGEKKFAIAELKFPNFDAKVSPIFEILSIIYLSKGLISCNMNALSEGMLVFAVNNFKYPNICS